MAPEHCKASATLGGGGGGCLAGQASTVCWLLACAVPSKHDWSSAKGTSILAEAACSPVAGAWGTHRLNEAICEEAWLAGGLVDGPQQLQAGG